MSAIDSLLPDSGKIAIDKPHPYQQLVSDQLLLGRTAHLRGHVSKEWKQAFVEARGPTTNPNIEQVASVWMVKFIKTLWDYSKAVWTARNSAVHGHTTTFSTSQGLLNLQKEAMSWFAKFESDPHCIPEARRYLFNRPISSILSLDRDSLKCWCSSVKEAELTAKQREELCYKMR
jgi:hypothetical protein